MKKLLTVFIMFIMCFTLNVYAIPDPEYDPLVEETLNGSGNVDVSAEYVPSTYDEIGEIKFAWGPMKFKYNAPDYYWDYVNEVYVSKENGGWVSSGYLNNTIRFTNSTGIDVSISLSFTPVSNTGVTGGTFSCGNSLVVSKRTSATSPTTEEITFMPEGELIQTSGNTNNFENIGRITVTIQQQF